MTRRRDISTISRVGAEALDTPALDRTTARATLRDIARANLLFGGQAAVKHGLTNVLQPGPHPPALTVLDVGAGAGDILATVIRMLTRRGTRAVGIAIDWHREAATMVLEQGQHTLVGDAMELPLGTGSVDVVVASQLLHHFTRDAGVRLVQELDRVARVGVVIADIRRALPAAWGIWLAAHALRFHRVSRADGVVSVRRGFSRSELENVCDAAGVAAVVQRRPGFRLVAFWRSKRAHS